MARLVAFWSLSLLLWQTICPANGHAADWQNVPAVLPSGLSYNERWQPPGEDSVWRMDCSNTARWIYRSVAGVDLPRTASDQYLFLKKHGRIWRINPENGRALQRRLRPGDFLFWEYTYRPVRRPPITHVMVYLGTDSAGKWQMAGSKSSAGVGIFQFQPLQPSGGYRYFFGLFKRKGRFVAVGRFRA